MFCRMLVASQGWWLGSTSLIWVVAWPSNERRCIFVVAKAPCMFVASQGWWLGHAGTAKYIFASARLRHKIFYFFFLGEASEATKKRGIALSHCSPLQLYRAQITVLHHVSFNNSGDALRFLFRVLVRDSACYLNTATRCVDVCNVCTPSADTANVWCLVG